MLDDVFDVASISVSAVQPTFQLLGDREARLTILQLFQTVHMLETCLRTFKLSLRVSSVYEVNPLASLRFATEMESLRGPSFSFIFRAPA